MASHPSSSGQAKLALPETQHYRDVKLDSQQPEQESVSQQELPEEQELTAAAQQGACGQGICRSAELA